MRLCAITDEIASDLHYALSVMVEYGCQDAELRNVYDKYIVDADSDTIARVKSDIAEFGMRVACIDTPLYKCELFDTRTTETGATHGAKERTLDDQMHLLERSITLCETFDTRFIRIFSFWRRGALTAEIEDRIAEILTRAGELAQRAGVTLLIENEHACYLGTGKETARIVETIGSPAVQMIWDPGNAFMAGERPFPHGWDAAKMHTRHLHIKDARVDAAGTPQWCVVGEGEIDYAAQFAALKAIHFDGAISLETHYHDPQSGKEGASRASLVAMKRLVEAA